MCISTVVLKKYVISEEMSSKKKESRGRPSNHIDFQKMYYSSYHKYVYAKSWLINTFKKKETMDLFQ